MNYKAIHDSIIERGRNRTREEGVYYENHHVIPKCEGGDPNGETVPLIFKEHRAVHFLRYKITGNTNHLHAYNLMKYGGEEGRRKNARKAAKMVKNYGGMASKEWREDNPEKCFTFSSKGGKIGSYTFSWYWWNDGERNTRSMECPGDGWVRGMLKKLDQLERITKLGRASKGMSNADRQKYGVKV